MKILERLLALFVLLGALAVHAAPSNCIQNSSTCVDNTPCKTIAGETVCLADMGETCWKYTNNFTCLKEAAEIQCNPLVALMPDCWQTSSTCVASNPDGSCFTYRQNWQCKDWAMATPPSAVKLPDTITYVSDKINTSACDAFIKNGCSQTAETCIEPAETRLISGIPVTKDCWKWSRTYVCSHTSASDCLPLETDTGCKLQSTTCTSTNPDGSCALYAKSFTCTDGTLTASASSECGGSDAPCTTQTTVLPPQAYTQGCTESMEPTPVTCSRTRNVEVDKGYLYRCTETAVLNTCTPLQDAGCWLAAAPVCVSLAPDNTCLEYENTLRCANEQTALPAGVSFIDYVFTITKDTIDNPCLVNETNPACVLESEVCVEPGGTRNINGLDVTKDCWKWERNYTCGVFDNSQCADLVANPQCALTSTTCAETLADSDTCIVWDKNFTCVDSSAASSQAVTSCENKVTCINGFCFNSGAPPDPDFAKPVMWLEIAREAGIYQDPDTLEIFKGTGSHCRERAWGSCCKVKYAGDTANSEQYGASSFGISVAGTAVRNVVGFMGSPYVFDALFSSDLVPTGVFNALAGVGIIGGTAWAPNISAWGVKVAITPAVGGGFTLGFAFDPVSLALSVAMYVVTEVLTCSMTQDEGILALRRGANLCHYVGSYCSKKILGWCSERKQGYCCYNSKLARLINVQGRAQLGKSFGSAKTPNCSGFSPTELASLDFSLIDLSEFIADIKPKSLDVAGTAAVIADNVQCKTENGSYFGGTNPLCNKSSAQGVIYNVPVMEP